MNLSPLVIVLLASFLAFPVNAQPDEIVLLANSIDYSLANETIRHWQTQGIGVKHINPVQYSTCDPCKSGNVLIILGGSDAYEGVGAVVKDILTIEEQNLVRDTQKMFVKTGEEGQKIIIFAGPTRNETNTILKLNKGYPLSLISPKTETSQATSSGATPSETVSPEVTTVFSLSIQSKEVSQGSNTNLQIRIENANESIGSLQFDLRYNSSVIEITGVSNGELSSSAIIAENRDNAQGKLTIGIVSLEGFSGSGPIAEISVNIIGERGVSTQLDLFMEGNGMIADTQNNPLTLPYLRNGELRVT